MLTPSEISALALNDFLLDLKDAVLTQRGTATPTIWRGPGTLRITSTGRIAIKIHLLNEVNVFEKFASLMQHEVGAGKIVEDLEYYDLSATDYSGRVWTSQRFMIDHSLYAQTNSGTVNAELGKITTSRDIEKPSSNFTESAHFRGKPRIPYSLFESQPDGSKTRSSTKIEIDQETSVNIRDTGTTTQIFIDCSTNNCTTQMVDNIKEAISIATGGSLTYLYTERRDKHKVETSIWSNTSPNAIEDDGPWPLFDVRHSHHFADFVRNYATRLRAPSRYFGYWEKIHAAWKTGVFVAALPLSIYVEGVTKDFFPELQHEPPEFKVKVDKIIEHIRSSTLDQEVIDRCAGALQGIKSKSATKAIKSLQDQGYFSKYITDAWRSIRNSVAHGNDINNSEKELQALLDDTMKCLHLFYVLLFVYIEFRGEFIDYSTHGFPTTRLNLPS